MTIASGGEGAGAGGAGAGAGAGGAPGGGAGPLGNVGAAPAAILGEGAGAAPAAPGAAPAAGAGDGGPQWKYVPADAAELAQIPLPAGVLGDKYKTVQDLLNGTSAAVAQRDQYAERLKGFPGAPLAEDGTTPAYKFTAPEGYEAEIDTANPLYEKLTSMLAKAGASQEVYDGITGLLVQYEAARGDRDVAETMETLAQVYHTPELRDAKLAELNRFYNPLLPTDARKLLAEVSTDARVVQIFDHLKAALTASNISVDINGGQTPGAAKVEQLANDPKIMTDNAKLGQLEQTIQQQAARRR